MESPELSVVMPAYNVAGLICKAIESVKAQSFADWELIVVDDGSPDNLKDAVMPYVAEDRRIHLVSKANGGLSDARNYGLRHAHGRYIHFFDPDDYICDRDWYGKCMGILKQTALMVDLLITGYLVEYKSRAGASRLVNRPLSIPFPGQYGEGCTGHVCYAWNKMFRREFLLEHELLYEKGLSRIEDAEFMSRVVEYRPNIKYMEAGGYVYVQRDALTLSKGFDIHQIALSERRIGMDALLIEYFNVDRGNITRLADHLRSRNVISTVNRLYSFGQSLSKSRRHEILAQIEVLLPERYVPGNNEFIRRIYDYLLYLTLKYKQYRVMDFLQMFRR